jgi:hypothetical protein
MSKIKMRLGADPEVFLIDGGGTPISAIGKFGGTKHKPKPLDGLAPGFTVQEDNVAVEFGIPPAHNQTTFVRYIQMVQEKVLEQMASSGKTAHLKFAKVSCVMMQDDQLQHPMSHEFGCEPDYNAWTGQENAKPKGSHPNLRTAGGHVHVETQLDPKKVVQAMDLFLGIPSLTMDTGSAAAKRRQMYGKAGAMRFKPYGLEYRVLSNFWIFKETYIKWVWNQTAKALAFVAKNEQVPDYVEDVINANDVVIAKHLMKEFSLQ